MPSDKYLYYKFIAEKTVEDLINTNGYWMRFLETSARMYKYPFSEQLMIYAQRPNTIACATFETWTETFNRWVVRGSKGIALFDDTWSKPQLKYVFDVADTEALRINARPVQLWEMRSEHRDPVLIELAKSYEGVTDTLSDTFHNIAIELATEYYDDNELDIRVKAEESFFGHTSGYDVNGVIEEENNLRPAFINALSRSIEYSLLSRCGLDTSESFDEDDFKNIYQFNTSDMIYTLGTAVSDLSEQVLRDIEVVIKKYERQHAAERSEQEYDRNPYLHDGRRLSDPGHHLIGTDVGADGNDGQIREDAESLSEGTQADQLQQTAIDGEAISAPDGSGRNGDITDRTDDDRVNIDEQSTGQSDRPDGMDSEDEFIESTSGGDSPARDDLQLEEAEPPSTFSQIGKSSIEDLLSTSPITLDEVDTILRDGGNEKNSHLRIAAYFIKTLENNDEFLKREYLNGRYWHSERETGKGFIFGDKKVSVWYAQDGIFLNTGTTAQHNNNSIFISWEQAAERINELMITGRYLTGDLLDEALDNEISNLAEDLWSFYRDTMNGVPDKWKSSEGYYGDKDLIKSSLSDDIERLNIIKTLEEDIVEWKNNPGRRKWAKPERTLTNMYTAINIPMIPTNTEYHDPISFKYFITEDEIDAYFLQRGFFNEVRFEKLSFFLKNSDQKDRIDFLKNRYGHGGGSWHDTNGWYDATPGTGISLSRRDGTKSLADVKLNWNQVLKRFEKLIDSGRYINRDDLDLLHKYETLHVGNTIKKFYSDLPEEYDRPFPNEVNLNYPSEEGLEILQSFLGDTLRVDGVLDQMQYILINTPENDRYYKVRNDGFEALSKYREGTFKLFPGLDEIIDLSSKRRLRDDVNGSHERDYEDSQQDNEQMSLFGMVTPLPTAEQQRERIDQILRNEAEQIKLEAGIDEVPALSLPQTLDDILLAASDENKTHITAQFALNPRSRESVNLIREVYGDITGITVQQTIQKLEELIEDEKYITVSDIFGVDELISQEDIFTEITDPTVIAEVEDIFGDNKSIFEEPELALRLSLFIIENYDSNYDDYADGEEGFETVEFSPAVISDLLQNDRSMIIDILKELATDEKISTVATAFIKEVQNELQPIVTQDPKPVIPVPERHNFRITDDTLGEGNPKTKFFNNLNALYTLKAIENDERNAIPEEQETLSLYVGWGGLPQAFDQNNSQWVNEYKELKAFLSPEEWESARASTLNAHYTPPLIIKAMYHTIEQLGFKTGNILEPSCGVGNFLGLLPDSMKNSKVYGVELDSITARIAQQLYPNATIQHRGFEKADFPDSFFDIAIGNVPFGQYGVADSRYDKYGFNIHNYFFAKTLDKVRPGGIVAFITSKYTLDEKSPKVRRYIAEQAELLGAVRLPNNAFLKNAGTETTMDILILQKRDRPLDIEPEWVHLGINDDGIPLNRYFIDNPEMILGKMALDERMNNKYGKDDITACLPIEDANFADQLDVALSYIDGKYTVEELDDLDGIDNHAIPADANVKNFSYALVTPTESESSGTLFSDNMNNARVYFRENSLMYPVDLPVTTLERIKGMINLRDCVQKLISLQLDESGDVEIKEQQQQLNSLYDNFSAEFGFINSSANNRAFNADSSYYLLCSLEILDEDGELDRKADMFTKRTIKQKNVITRVDTPSEALAVSISEKACVDLDFMSKISMLNKQKLINDLKGVIFLNVGSAGSQHETYITADEYLSGNVRKKLEWAKTAAEVDPSLDINVKALEAVQPKELEATDIAVRLGATWISPDYINQFMHDLMESNWRMKTTYKVSYHPITDSWQVTGKGKAQYSDIHATVTYGTERANAYEIIDDTLNLRDVRVYDYNYDADGNKKRVLNKKETTLAQQKQELIKQKFQDWIWKDPERRHTLVKLYNERFNSHRPREYDGSHIQFIGANPDISFHPHQINAVARQIYGGNTLLAHVVGAGKTFEMVGAAMESKRLGLCHKSLFAVPNHLTEQWGAEFLRLYPNANILVARKKDFEMRNRKKFCAKIATGEYDAVIIGHSQMEKIPMSRERQERLLRDQIHELEDGIKELKAANGERWSIKQLERTKKSLEVRLMKLFDSKKRDDVVTFEQLGVDRLFVDEAHNFKNLFMFTKMRNVAGLSTSEAQKSSDLFMKCRYMDELTGGKGIIFATGTPISNSMTEMYTMQRYLQYDRLSEKGLTHFDAWASIFGETQTSIELAPEGTGYRARTRFAKFHNLPELMCMFKDVADIQTADMINLPVPDAKYDTVIVEPSDMQKEMVQELSERAAAVQARLVDPSTDNMLKITTDGRKIGLDQRLINPLLPDFEGSKVNACTDNVFNIWNETISNRLTQLVFCDFSTPNKDGRFNVYDDIRAKLIERGIPESEVAFIHDADTETKKKELFSKVRQGKVRVLFGSTFKMGSGTNVQDKLIAIHDADCPWRPADLEQRAGRIVRQGNQNPEVMIYRYATNGTFDSYLWQTVQKKQEFISQIMTSKSPVRSCEDVDETALSYAEIKALCAGNPLIAEKMNLDIDVTKLRMLKAEHQSQRHRLEDDLMTNFPKRETAVKERIAGIEKDAKHYAEEKAKCTDVQLISGSASVSTRFPGMTINNVTYKEKEPAAKALLDVCKGLYGRFEKDIQGVYMGFALSLKYGGGIDKQITLLLRRMLTYQVDLGTDAFGNITRINNVLDSLPDRLDGAKEDYANIQKQIEAAKLEIDKPFTLSDELNEKEARLAMLNAELNIEGEGYFDIVSNPDERDPDEEPDIVSDDEPDEDDFEETEYDDESAYDYQYTQSPQLVSAKNPKPSILEGIRDYENIKPQNTPPKEKQVGLNL